MLCRYHVNVNMASCFTHQHSHFYHELCLQQSYFETHCNCSLESKPRRFFYSCVKVSSLRSTWYHVSLMNIIFFSRATNEASLRFPNGFKIEKLLSKVWHYGVFSTMRQSHYGAIIVLTLRIGAFSSGTELCIVKWMKWVEMTLKL